MEQINRNVEGIVKMLQEHPSVQQVFHPSIESHLNHDIHIAQASVILALLHLKSKIQKQLNN